jgi:hypothetical protein
MRGREEKEKGEMPEEKIKVEEEEERVTEEKEIDPPTAVTSECFISSSPPENMKEHESREKREEEGEEWKREDGGFVKGGTEKIR